MNLDQIKILEELHHSHRRFAVIRFWLVDKDGRYNCGSDKATNGLTQKEYEGLNKKGYLDIIASYKDLESDDLM